MSLSFNDRSDCVERAQWCPIHLSGHKLDDCNMRNDARYICGINGCTKHHHKSLHDSNTPFLLRVNATDTTAISNADNVLLLVQTIPTPSGDINCFWDNGSTCSLITRAKAEQLRLPGKPMSISIKTVTGWVAIDSMAYQVSLIDINNESHTLVAFSVEDISNKLDAVDISKAKGQFSTTIQNVWHLLERPTGDIELLIGLNAYSLHPREYESSSNLKVLRSQFGSGYLLGGAHPFIKSKNIELNETVSSLRHATTHTVNAVNRISIKPSYEFFEGEIMGIHPPKIA